MKSGFKRLVLVPLAVAGATCAHSTPAGTEPDLISQDFCLNYELTGGSIPPLHHAQYRIRACATGQATLVVVAGYPTIFDEIKRFDSSAKIDPNRWLLIYSLSSKAAQSWVPDEGTQLSSVRLDPIEPSGSSTCKLSIEDHASNQDIPCDNLKNQFIPERKELESALYGLFPKSTWENAASTLNVHIDSPDA